MKVSMFTKEEMHADQAKFCLLVLISNYTRDPWRRSLTSQTDHWGERQMRHILPSISPQRKCHANVRPWDAQSCRHDKGSLFSFHTFPKDSSPRKLHPWRFELEIVPSRLPCGHPHRHDFFFTRGYRSRNAQLSLGWSLVDGRKGLFGWNPCPCQFYKEYIQTNQRTQIHFDTLAPSAKIKIKKGKKLFHKKPSRKRMGNQQKRQMNTQILSKNELVINAEEEEGRERKQTKNGHGKHGEKKGKTGGTTIELPTNTPALSKKQNKSEAKTQWKQPREK